MEKLKMSDVFTREGYKGLTAAERRQALKMEQAKQYSGLRPYHNTCASIIKQMPADIWDRYTAIQLGEIMELINAAYNRGKNDVDKSNDN